MPSIKPDKLDLEPSDPESSKKYKHWIRVFNAFVSAEESAVKEKDTTVNKLDFLIALVNHSIYEVIEDASTYEDALKLLEDMFIQQKNILYTRHALITRKQKEGESLSEYVAALKSLAKDCAFESVTAVEHKETYIVDAFVSGLRNTDTKRKILESSKTQLTEIINMARVYEDARERVVEFSAQRPVACPISEETERTENMNTSAAVKNSGQNYPASPQYRRGCGWCGDKSRHPRDQCPARNSQCGKCGLRGHWAKVCRGGAKGPSPMARGPSAVILPILASINSVPKCLEKSTMMVGIGPREVAALRDTGSGGDYIHPAVVEKCNLQVFPEEGALSMANTAQISKTTGYVMATLQIYGRKYHNVKLTVLPNSCVDIILGIFF